MLNSSSVDADIRGDAFVLDLQTITWTEITNHFQGTPSNRYGHRMVAANSTVYLHAGFGQSGGTSVWNTKHILCLKSRSESMLVANACYYFAYSVEPFLGAVLCLLLSLRT
jgi:hypothetical protein